jgi:hypothetical protein
VVVVNVSRWRCDALIVRRDGVTGRELAGLTLDEAAARANRYLSVLSDAELADLRRLAAQRPKPGRRPRDAVRRRFAVSRDLEVAHQRVDEMLADLLVWDVARRRRAGPGRAGLHRNPRRGDRHMVASLVVPDRPVHHPASAYDRPAPRSRRGPYPRSHQDTRASPQPPSGRSPARHARWRGGRGVAGGSAAGGAATSRRGRDGSRPR